MSKRTARTTAAQYSIILEYFSNHREMITNKLNPLEYSKNVENWQHLASILNSDGAGPTKSVKEWKRVITEWKCNTKRKARDLKQEIVQTGGGISKVKPLTEVEERLLDLIGRISVDGAEIVEPGLDTLQVECNEHIVIEEIVQETNTNETSNTSISEYRNKRKRNAVDQITQLQSDYMTVTEKNTDSNIALNDTLIMLSQSMEKLADSNNQIAELNLKIAEALEKYAAAKMAKISK